MGIESRLGLGVRLQMRTELRCDSSLTNPHARKSMGKAGGGEKEALNGLSIMRPRFKKPSRKKVSTSEKGLIEIWGLVLRAKVGGRRAN